MSYSRNTNTKSYRNSGISNSGSSSTPFCKVCKDSGCSEAEYTSHFVKDQPGPNGKVICPTLLNQACRICHAKGHTSSYCPQYRPRDVPHDHQYQARTTYESDHVMPPRPVYHNNMSRNIYPERVEHDRERHHHHTRDESLASSARRAPYAHPHGPRTRLQLDAPALSAASVKKAESSETMETMAILSTIPVDVRDIDLKHAKKWGDEPEGTMSSSEFRTLVQDSIMNSLISDREFELIVQCDADNGQ